jgi:hypothetical protein
MYRKKNTSEKVQLEKINTFGAGKIPATQIPQANEMTNKVLATSGCYCHTLWILIGCAETGFNPKRRGRTTVVSNNLCFVDGVLFANLWLHTVIQT